MLYPFMTLEDETEIVHSEPLTVDGKEKVKVVIEQPVTGGFHSAVCWLPDYTWEKIEGFSKEEINQYQELIESVSHVIIELAITRNGKEVGRIIPRKAVISYLTDSLTGILSESTDMDQVREERLKAKYESAD